MSEITIEEYKPDLNGEYFHDAQLLMDEIHRLRDGINRMRGMTEHRLGNIPEYEVLSMHPVMMLKYIAKVLGEEHG